MDERVRKIHFSAQAPSDEVREHFYLAVWCGVVSMTDNFLRATSDMKLVTCGSCLRLASTHEVD